MAATDTTRLTIELQTLLRGLSQTLRGLDQIKKRLDSLASVKLNQQSAQAADRAAASIQRLSNAQQQATASSRTLSEQADAHVKAFRAMEKQAKATSDRIVGLGNSLRSVGQGLSTIGSTLSLAVTAPIVALGAASISAAVQMDSLRRGLTAIVGSSSEAGRQLARLTEIAKLPGIGFQEAIQGSIRLQAVGFSANEAERALRQFSNAIALTGGGRDELARVTVQLGQLAAKGKVLSQDLRPIIEAAPAVGRALLQAFGTVNASDIEALGLTTKEFFDALVGQLEQLPRAAAGAKNSFENFRDTVFRAGAAVGEALLPPLIRLVEVAGPIITKLAETFNSLPAPLQVTVVALGGLLAALGPALFVIGQLTTGVGRLLVGFGQLSALGLLPTIRNLKLLVTGTLSAVEAQKALASTTAVVSAGLGVAALAIGAIVAAYLIYNSLQEDTLSISKERINQLNDEIKSLEEQTKFLNSLQAGVKRTADEQARLTEIYFSLNTQARIRLAGITDEEQRLAKLREELQLLLQLRNQERIQQAASLAASFADTVAQIKATEDQRDSIAGRIQANTALIESINKTGGSTRELNKILDQQNLTGQSAEQVVHNLGRANEQLLRIQDEAIKTGDKLNGTAREQAEILHSLERQTGLSAEQILIAAKSMGVFQGDIQQTLTLLHQYTADTEEATRATDAFSQALKGQVSDLLKAGDAADDLAKKRRALISAAGSLAREASDSFEGALKFMQAFIAAQPRLREAVERERKLEGKSLAEFLHDELEKSFKGRPKDKSGTSLRNAQEELAKALAEVALASSEEQVRIKKEEGERLLRQAEISQKLQLTSYREFLETRARISGESLDEEIRHQGEVVAAAKKTQAELLAAAQKPGIPAAESVRRQAQAAKANEEAVKAETKLNELTRKRSDIEFELKQDLAVAQHEQVKDIRQLDIEFAELQGRIEDALNAATVEKFREKLTDLALTQDRLNKQLRQAQKQGNADRATELGQAIRINQAQIDAIQFIVQQEQASNNLAAAQELVRRAKEKQADLESQLGFEVENRGLKEEDSIRRRLEGEQKLVKSLELARDVVKDTIAALQAQGVEPPQALVEFVRDINASLRGLGELSISEKFRLVNDEFKRLNTERIQKIEDVERAIRNRTIAEVEGSIIIHNLNGQYSADLEQQLTLLKQLAEQVGKGPLRDQLNEQIADAGKSVKDAKDDIAGFGKELRAVSIDATRLGLIDFITSLGDRTKTFAEKAKAALDGIVAQIEQIIARRLVDDLFDSLFGLEGKKSIGIVDAIKGLFGGGRKGVVGAAGTISGGEIALSTTEAATHTAEATAASTALVTGATSAATALVTGGTAAATTLTASITAAATAFTAAVTAAGAAFAALVTSAAAAGGIGQSIGGLGGVLGAATGMFPAIPGGAIRFVEGGFPEAVLTTDPRHAARQVAILRQFLQETRGLGGRIRSFAMGGFTDHIDISAPSVNLSNAGIGELAVAGTPSTMRLRQVLVDERNLGDWVNSSEGEQVMVDFLHRHAPVIRKIGGGRK